MESTVEEINSMSRSHHRIRILAWLLADGRLTIDEFRDRTDASRTTVNRNLEALEAQGWLQRTNREYALTPAGELVAEKFLELVDVVRVTMQLRPLAGWLPTAILDLDVRALDGATVVTADPTDPYAPVSRHVDAMESSTHFRCMLPAVGLPAMKTAHSRIVEDDCRHEIVAHEEVLRTLTGTPSYRGLLTEMLESGRLDVFVSEQECQFYLGITGTLVQLGVQDHEGVPRGLVELDSPAARHWAERTYEDYKDRSRLFRPSADGDADDSPLTEQIAPYLD